MQIHTKACLAGGLTEAFFALCWVYGEEPDVDSGDLTGLIGLFGRLPIAFLRWLVPIFPDELSPAWVIVMGWAFWTLCWWMVLAISRSRRRQLNRIPAN